MTVLGIETSCDECSIAVVCDGRQILSNVIASQVERHSPWNGVVPEIASRLHVEWIDSVCSKALKEAGVNLADGVDAIGVTSKPGLIGSLLVGLSYAKALAWSSAKPWVEVDHILAHIFAAHLEYDIDFPYLGLIVSGGHTILCRVEAMNSIEVLGTTIDDACGEAFDKVAKHYNMGYPGGVALDRLAENGDDKAYAFPTPRLQALKHRYDVSYSGLKTAAVNQLQKFCVNNSKSSIENIAASFRKAAIDMLVNKVKKASYDTGIHRVVAGGGVSANLYLRRVLQNDDELETYFPSMALCTDNAAMIAALAYHQLANGDIGKLNASAFARVSGFKHRYS